MIGASTDRIERWSSGNPGRPFPRTGLGHPELLKIALRMSMQAEQNIAGVIISNGFGRGGGWNRMELEVLHRAIFKHSETGNSTFISYINCTLYCSKTKSC